MLRRNSSRNKQRRPLGRSKSTSSVVRNPVHHLDSIDPITAERDAHIAATLSYYRAMERRRSGDMAALSRDQPSFAWSRLNNAANKHGVARSDNGISRQAAPNSVCGLKRQQSVRFAGPNAKPRKALAARAGGGRGPRPGDGSLLQSGNSNHRSVVDSMQNYVSELQASEEYYTPEDDVASAPSSYKRIRKSKSMFTSSNSPPPERCLHNGSSDLTKRWLSDYRFSSLNKENEPLPDVTAPSLRAPKSASFLRQRREQTASRTSSRADNDLAVHHAREKFREQVEQQSRLKSHPSLFFRTKFKSSESSAGFRRSLRNTSNTSTGLSSAFSTNTLSIPKHAGLRKTARKVSKTLKSKLKGLFGKTKSTDSADEHGQESDGDSCLGLGDPPPPEEASMSRVPSRMPSLHAVPSNQQMRSHQGSMESLEGEEHHLADDKSRVTSWTNSTTNTITSQGTAGDWERQRLSVIKENGMHVSSSLSQPPNPHEAFLSATTLGIEPVVDSQRVYSALMKRLEETKNREENMRKRSVEDFVSHGIAPPRSSSVDQHGSKDWSPSTIRCVQEEDDVFQDRKNKFELCDDESPLADMGRGAKVPVSGTSSPSHQAWSSRAASDDRIPSTEKSLSRTTMNSPRAVSHRTSAFFASPTCHLFRTASPFRRALQENMKAREPQHLLSPETRQLEALSALHLPVRRQSASDSEKGPRSTYADSVYSSGADDTQGCRITSVAESFPQPPRGGHGDVTIFVDPPVYRPSPSHMRDVSSASSVEWKTWLSANVSKLEDSRGGSYTLPTIGHVREHAEIDSPGEVLKSEMYNPWHSGPDLPLRAVEAIPPSNSSQPSSQKTQDRSSALVDENSAPIKTDDYSKPPPIPYRNVLRLVPSLPSMKAETFNEGDNIPRMRSYNTIALAKSSPISRDDMQLKRRSRARLGGISSVKSSPGLTSAVEKQFGKPNTVSSDTKVEKKRGQGIWTSKSAGHASVDDLNGAGLLGPDVDAQVMGSKRMVDLFLSSRRRRIQGSGTGTGSETSAAAFL